MAFPIRILDAQHEGAAHLAGEQIVEQCRAGTADVQIPRRGGGKSRAYLRCHARLIHPRGIFCKRKPTPPRRNLRHAGRSDREGLTAEIFGKEGACLALSRLHTAVAIVDE